ncbi:hypothetical protein [Spirosoma montaniterrae]|uniref:Uncharacterized protein n=1 Tax=Spirosoma montaniterrae TaxID=1178516 RepID=A0A1P9WWE7_9BACT|nr:hypothetical protein [Spirosoma montaniterrae]AQG79699.1 hypothetical protein AWR27_10390 [Spirosoma montaniterrae]
MIIVLFICSMADGLAQPRTNINPLTYRASQIAARRAAAIPDHQIIENDKIRAGINLRYGGSITYLAFKDNRGGLASTENMVNNNDLGRQVQIALYSGPSDYSQRGASAWVGLGWNPIQAGDTWGNPARILDFRKEDNLLYVKSVPMQFAINNEPGEATIEHWIRLDGNAVKVHCRVVMFRSDKTQYEARGQEMPCVYLNGGYRNIHYYAGRQPFTNDGLQIDRYNVQTERDGTRAEFGNVFPSEPWMASVNDNQYGVGLYYPNMYDWTRGYFGFDYGGNELGGDASYIAVSNFEVLDHNIVHEWDYELILGSVSEIRSYVYSKPRPAAGPNYRFLASRQGWHYYKTFDTGWPIQNKLHIRLDNPRSNEIKSPSVLWRGASNQQLYLRAAFKTQQKRFRLSWRNLEDRAIRVNDPNRYHEFPIENDGQMRTYRIDLSQNDNWKSALVNQIALKAVDGETNTDGWVEIEWMARSENGPTSETQQPEQPPVVVGPPITDGPVDEGCKPGCVPIKVERIRYARAVPR